MTDDFVEHSGLQLASWLYARTGLERWKEEWLLEVTVTCLWETHRGQHFDDDMIDQVRCMTL